jgi:hypothetical protein
VGERAQLLRNQLLHRPHLLHNGPGVHAAPSDRVKGCGGWRNERPPALGEASRRVSGLCLAEKVCRALAGVFTACVRMCAAHVAI